MRQADIARDLQRMGIRANDTLLVHSSFSSFGKMTQGANDFIDELKAFLWKGTLLLPAFSFGFVTEKNPCFDIRKTQSCVGYLAEVFRRRTDVVRSMHPTHSVCATGVRAIEITSEHHKDSTPCGENSPFHLLPHYGGKILMIGCGLRPNTSMHAIEETSRPSYLFGGTLNYTIVDDRGRAQDRTYTVHGFEGWAQRYDRVMRVVRRGGITRSKLLGAECYLIDAQCLWADVKDRISSDEFFFVERENASS